MNRENAIESELIGVLEDRDEAQEEIARLRRLLRDIKETAVENVHLCQLGHSQVAEEWCYELAELEY